ncbi:MAG: DUF4136 domain-containing protein [Alphaproteobacteria bacterium]
MRMHTATILAALALAGCARTTTCDVVAFHQLPPPAGETIAVTAADAAVAADPAFADHATRVAAALGRLGYTPVADGAAAALVAEIGYGIEEEDSHTVALPVCSSHYHFGYRRFDDPYWYGYRCRPWHTLTAERYLRHLDLRIVDGTSGAALFEGRVQSQGADRDLAAVMPYLVTALFANFPGESGVVKTVTIERDSTLPPAGAAATPGPAACGGTAQG